MRIGILTLHDATNYGAVLQACGTYRVLSDWGYDVRLIDRRRNPQGYAINYPYSHEGLVRMIWRYMNFTGAVLEGVRRWRTYFFQRKWLKFTPYHFHDWKEAPKNLGIDAMVVGSDQIWNKDIQDPMDYMLANMKTQVPSITYAASMGMPEIPREYEAGFREWMPKFKAVSVRESSMIPLLARFGVEATRVVDPVVLAGTEYWKKFVGKQAARNNRIFVYTLGIEDELAVKRKMAAFAKKQGCKVEVFIGRKLLMPTSFQRPIQLVINLYYWMRLFSSRRVRMRLIAGPLQFLRALASAEAVVTNSYHALVFSAIFGKNVRYVIPTGKFQGAMMVRIREYADSIIKGPLLQPTLDAALESIAAGEKTAVDLSELESRRQKSIQWLSAALQKV